MNASELKKLKNQFRSLRFKSKAEVDEYLSHNRLTCLICGSSYISLGTHVLRMHNVKIEEYKEIFNIPWCRGIVGSSTRKKQSDNMKRRIEEGDPTLTPISSIAELRNKAPKRQVRDFRISELNENINLIAKKKKEMSREKALILLDIMEKYNCTVYMACKKTGADIGAHNLFSACKHDPDIRKRYDDQYKTQVLNMEEDKEERKDELRKVVIALRDDGWSYLDIAKYLRIGRTSVQRLVKRY